VIIKIITPLILPAVPLSEQPAVGQIPVLINLS
jgi:hypothetical protein